MKKLLFPSLAIVMSLTLIACNNNKDTNGTSQQEPSGDTSTKEISEFSRDLVEFPENYDKGVNYTTVNRGNVREELYTSKDAIEAVQSGKPIPSGTVITLEIYSDEKLSEIFVMEKRTGWGDQIPEGTPRNGDWQYEEFNADRSLDYEEDIGRCFTCHANQERDDFMNTLDEMKDFDLEEFTGSKDSDTEPQIGGISAAQWEVMEVDNNLEDPKNNMHGERSDLMGDKEKAELVQKVLLINHFNK